MKGKNRTSTLSSIFGEHKECDLPYPTSIALYDKCPCDKVSPLSQKEEELLDDLRKVDERSYFHATNHGAHALNFLAMLDLSEVNYQHIYVSAILHDIGKRHYHEIVSIPRTLTPDEYAQVKEHSIRSFIDLQNAEAPEFVQFAGLLHHVSFDKKHGYPELDNTLAYKISRTAVLYHQKFFPIPSDFYKKISAKDWFLYSAISLLDAFDAATDINRVGNVTFGIHTPLNKVVDSFRAFWGIWYDPRLEEPFKKYVSWLETKLSQN